MSLLRPNSYYLFSRLHINKKNTSRSTVEQIFVLRCTREHSVYKKLPSSILILLTICLLLCKYLQFSLSNTLISLDRNNNMHLARCLIYVWHFRHTPTICNCRSFGCVLLLNHIYLTTMYLSTRPQRWT